MKVLIWILSVFGVVLLNELLGAAIGFKLGYALVGVLCYLVATAMCKVILKEDPAAKKKKVKGAKKAPAITGGPIPGGWTCPACGTNHEPTTNFCDKCGTPKNAPAPQLPPQEMVPPQLPDMEMTQPEELIRQAPPAPVQPVVPVQPVQPVMPAQPPHPSYAPPHPSSQPYPAAAIKFYVSSLNTEVSVTRPSFTVGRDATSDLSLARLPNAKYIARRQASFFCSGGTWYIRDENSTNGTFLNNRQIPGGQPQVLNLGDFISFAGKETLIVQDMK